ncbi:MAG: hypothetical protein KKA19_03000 [Candidatus Margulisbacteria bacterium]|nr:hypothetical protein [Candidatus Margulisiibacteriota bacterium]
MADNKDTAWKMVRISTDSFKAVKILAAFERRNIGDILTEAANNYVKLKKSALMEQCREYVSTAEEA